MAKPTFLNESVAFDEPVQTAGPGGVVTTEWTERYSCRAQFIYSRGSEAVEAARLEGRSTYKVRIRQCDAARDITSQWRMRDLRRLVENGAGDLIGGVYNIIEVDAISDRSWVYIVVQSGKAA